MDVKAKYAKLVIFPKNEYYMCVKIYYHIIDLIFLFIIVKHT